MTTDRHPRHPRLFAPLALALVLLAVQLLLDRHSLEHLFADHQGEAAEVCELCALAGSFGAPPPAEPSAQRLWRAERAIGWSLATPSVENRRFHRPAPRAPPVAEPSLREPDRSPANLNA